MSQEYKEIELSLSGFYLAIRKRLQEKCPKKLKDMEEGAIAPFDHPSMTLLPLAFKEDVITPEEYKEYQTLFAKKNPYIGIFGKTTAKGFGEEEMENHLINNFKEIKKATKKNQGPDFTGEYDLYITLDSGETVRLESKACRAMCSGEGPFMERALKTYEEDPENLVSWSGMKPSCSDVFVMMRVYTNRIKYFVLSSEEVKNHPHFTHQQRNSTQNMFSGKIFTQFKNIKELEVPKKDLIEAIKNKYMSLKKSKRKVA